MLQFLKAVSEREPSRSAENASRVDDKARESINKHTLAAVLLAGVADEGRIPDRRLAD
jgi:hypothetical protein